MTYDEYTDPYDISMSELRHWEYIGESILPPDTYDYDTLGAFIEHYGVKGMRWRHRKTTNIVDPSFMKNVRFLAAKASQLVSAALNGNLGKMRLITSGRRHVQSTTVSSSSADRLRSSRKR